jgi:hypothetical protein
MFILHMYRQWKDEESLPSRRTTCPGMPHRLGWPRHAQPAGPQPTSRFTDGPHAPPPNSAAAGDPRRVEDALRRPRRIGCRGGRKRTGQPAAHRSAPDSDHSPSDAPEPRPVPSNAPASVSAGLLHHELICEPVGYVQQQRSRGGGLGKQLSVPTWSRVFVSRLPPAASVRTRAAATEQG